MKKFRQLILMVLALILVLITIITVVEKYFTVTDFGLLIIVMVAVSVIPALARPVYIWMTAENEPEETREELCSKRSAKVLIISLIVIVPMAIFTALNIFGK